MKKTRTKRRPFGKIKFDLKMKLTAIFIFVTMFTIQANTYSQKTKITLSMENATVAHIMDEIEANTEFKFFFRSNVVDLNRQLTIRVNNDRIKSVLRKLFADTDIDYLIDDRKILLNKRIKQQKADVEPKTIDGEKPQFQISGTIVDETDQPLPGANIVEKGTSNGTQSDFDGNFTITVADQNAVLTISYIGFKTMDVTANGQTSLTITLEEDTAGLDEVVVVGYGTQKKVNLTGAVDVIDSELIESRPSATVSQLLQGTSPGLSFSVNNFGFQPGAELDIQIRGAGSINSQGGAPFIVIDGVPGDLNRLNPEILNLFPCLRMPQHLRSMEHGRLLE